MSPISSKLFLCLLCLSAVLGNIIHYRIVDRSRNKPGDKHTNNIGLIKAFVLLRWATETIVETFNQDINKGDDNIRKLTYDRLVLLVESFKEYHIPDNALTPSRTIGNTILVNTDYLQQFDGNLTEEFGGLVYHESTRLWQNNGKGHVPRGLLTWIADYMRLKAGFLGTHWNRRGSGLRWNEGFETTAYFLEYCDAIKGGGKFVRQLNAMMKDSYSDEYFERLMGKSVHELWVDYMKYFQSGKRESEYNQHFGDQVGKKMGGSVELITLEVTVSY